MQAYSTGPGPGAIPHVPLRRALPIFLLAVFLGQHVAAQSGELYGTEHPHCHSSTLAAAEAAAHIAAAAAAADNCTQSSSNNYHGGETTGTATAAAAAAATFDEELPIVTHLLRAPASCLYIGSSYN